MTAYEELLKIINRNMYTVHEVEEKLKTKGYMRAEIDEAVARALDFRYLDDENYAKIYVRKYSQTHGSLKIKTSLKLKGVSNEIIQGALSEQEENSEFESALLIAQKFAEKHDLSDEKNKARLFRSLAYRGFNYEIAKKCAESVKKSEADK